MHSYPKHIGDYAKAAMNLTHMADLAYRRMLDLYYDSERPLKADAATLAGEIGMDSYTAEVSLVLNRHFKLGTDGWHNKRADQVIAAYHAQIDGASKAGKASAAKRALNARSTSVQRSSNTRSTPVERSLKNVQPTNNHKPVTNNQEEDSVSSLRSETARAALFGNPSQWQEAVDAFGRQGVADRPARAHIAKLCREFGQEQAHRLLHDGIERDVVDLASYVEKMATPLRRTDAYLTSHMSDEEIERQNSRGAHPAGWRKPS